MCARGERPPRGRSAPRRRLEGRCRSGCPRAPRDAYKSGSGRAGQGGADAAQPPSEEAQSETQSVSAGWPPSDCYEAWREQNELIGSSRSASSGWPVGGHYRSRCRSAPSTSMRTGAFSRPDYGLVPCNRGPYAIYYPMRVRTPLSAAVPGPFRTGGGWTPCPRTAGSIEVHELLSQPGRVGWLPPLLNDVRSLKTFWPAHVNVAPFQTTWVLRLCFWTLLNALFS